MAASKGFYWSEEIDEDDDYIDDFDERDSFEDEDDDYDGE